MKRTREEYDNAIAILSITVNFKDAGRQSLEAMRELKDSAFALEEALVNLTGKAEAMLNWKRLQARTGNVGHLHEKEERAKDDLAFAVQIARIAQASIAPGTAQVGAAAPGPRRPLHPHQSEEIMDKGEPEKFTGPSGGLPDAGNSTPGV